MTIHLIITPQGELRVATPPRAEAEPPAALLSTAAAKGLVAAVEAGTAQGLLHLGTELLDADLPPEVGPGLGYLRDFSRQYLTALCRGAAQADALEIASVSPPSDAVLSAMVEDAPPITGSEYLNSEVLTRWWAALDQHVRGEVASHGGSAAGYLESRHPAWRAVGRVTFHLAENKRDTAYPFAFLATYTPQLSTGGQAQHLPLSRAVRESAKSKSRDQLLALLTPIQRAAKGIAWVKQLVDGGGIYQPLAWEPGQAYTFLQSVQALREAGLVVRTPDWWNAKSPPRARVSVSVGGAKQSVLGADALLDFSVGVTLQGQTLTHAELDELLLAADVDGGSGGLVRLGGRWVELDRDKLTQALDHWKQVERKTGDGVSFFEAMRWLATPTPGSAPGSSGETDDALAAEHHWVGIEPGPWLEQTLSKLRDPAGLKAAKVPGLLATLRPYQQTGVGWLNFVTALRLGACLADDMGLGKTIQVLAMLLGMKHEAKTVRKKMTGKNAGGNSGGRAAAPSLLVVPTSLMANWRGEIDRFAPSLRAITLHPAETTINLKNADALRKGVVGCDLVITTYGMVARLTALGELPWRVVILDEAQAIKNSGTRQTRAVKQLKADARIALTGTPVENRLSDLWSLFDFLNPGLLGSAPEFKRFVKQLTNDGHAHYAPLRRLVGPYILRRLKTDRRVIADLPDKTEVHAYCGLTKPQAALYQQSISELAKLLAESEGIQRRGLVLAYLMRFKQICNHPTQWHGSGGYDPAHSGKFQRLATLCAELAQRQERALVFTQFREITAPLAEHLAGVFGRPGLVLHGGTPVKKRQAMVADFQRDDGPPFFILSLKAGGTGLNLTAASHVIHFDRWWNPAVENQATDRAFRIGQKKNVLVHKFVCRGTVEEKIDAMIAEKTALAGAVIDADGGKMLTEMDDRALLDFVALDVNKAGEL